MSDDVPAEVSTTPEPLRIPLRDLRDLLIGLGHKTAGSWKATDPRWQSRLPQLPRFLADTDGPVAQAAAKLDPTQRRLLDEIVRAVGPEGPGLEIETEEEKEPQTQTENEEDTMPSKTETATKTEKKGKKAAPATSAAEKKAGPSNKARVWKLWTKNPEKFDAEKAFAAVDEAVKLITIRNWVSAWKNGKNLPAVAKEAPAE